ncbi:MAG: nucleotide exchange factor GrpE [Halobacteriovoraceae bacterium]|nr:nucleotide exchange factor GrpE [Halobacteriovoraceae bacterium]
MSEIKEQSEKKQTPVEEDAPKEEKEIKAKSREDAKENKKAPEEDYKKRYFYAAAELDNARKRFERERENWIKYGNEKILSDLIEVVDNLERTLNALREEKDKKVKNIVLGIGMVHKQFLEVLKNNGLAPVEALGKSFDPNFHEAMSQKAVKGKKPGEIVEEYQKGYILNGRLLRAAKVIVAKDAQTKDKGE